MVDCPVEGWSRTPSLSSFGETGLFTPSLKLAWLGDWNQGNEEQTIGFDFTDKTHSVGTNQEDCLRGGAVM